MRHVPLDATRPLLFMVNQGSGAKIVSDSLVRFQIYAALTFGSKGIYVYCWGIGVVNVPEHHDAAGHPWRLPGTPSVIYPCKWQSPDTNHHGRINAVCLTRRERLHRKPTPVCIHSDFRQA